VAVVHAAAHGHEKAARPGKAGVLGYVGYLNVLRGRE
jgi:hypothetical protein